MENREYIKELVSKYYAGDSSQEEDTILIELFLSEREIDVELEQERKVFRLLYAEHIPLPEGLEQRLEHCVDKHILQSKQPKKPSYLFRVSFVAAALILCLVVFRILLPASHEEYLMQDSYSDPKEAAIVAQNTVLFFANELNKGLSGLEKTQEELAKVNQILNKHQKK